MPRHVLFYSRESCAYIYGRLRQSMRCGALALADCRIYNGPTPPDCSPTQFAFRLATVGPTDGNVSTRAPRMAMGTLPCDIMLDITPAAYLVWEGANAVDLMLTAAGPNKIYVIKTIRGLTGIGLKEAKDLVEATTVGPQLVLRGINSAVGAAALKQIREAGAEGRLDTSS